MEKFAGNQGDQDVLGTKDELILAGILRDEALFHEVMPYLDVAYFSEEVSREIFSFIRDYWDEFKALPNLEALRWKFYETQKRSKAAVDFYRKILEEISQEAADPKFTSREIESWIRFRKYYIVLDEAVEAVSEDTDLKTTDPDLPQKIQDALTFSFSRDVGLEIESAEKIWDSFSEREEKTPFSLPIFNEITNNGVASKTLNVFLSSASGGGKTLAMCFLAGEYYRAGKNVLYVTAEMSEKRIYERILANLLDTEINALMLLGKEKFIKRLKAVDDSTPGRLVVKEFPTCSADCGDIRILLKDLAAKQKFKPDVLFLDYLNIFNSTRYKRNENMYVTVKGITEEFRGLLVEHELIGWTATQGNRSAIDMDDMSQKNVSESLGVVHTADFMLGIISNQALNNIGQYKMKQLKNRYNGINDYETFYVTADKPKMRLVDNISKAQQAQQRSALVPGIRLKQDQNRGISINAKEEKDQQGILREEEKEKTENLKAFTLRNKRREISL